MIRYIKIIGKETGILTPACFLPHNQIMRKTITAMLMLLLLASCAVPDPESEEELTMITEEEGRSIAAKAMNYLGIPYEWGGQGFWWEDNPSVDCSGFVINAYKTALEPYGKTLPFSDATVQGIYESFSEKTDSPIMGDLIFFTNGADTIPDHIAIYLHAEDGIVYFIDASSREDTMKVLVRSYPASEPMILSYGRMLCRNA